MINNFETKKLFAVSLLLFAFSFSSCKKLVETAPPSDRLTGESVFTSDATVIGTVTQFYAELSGIFSTSFLQGRSGVSFYTGLSGDELTLYNAITSGSQWFYFRNSLIGGPMNLGSELWNPFYRFVFRCNSAIEGLSKSNNLTPSVKQQLLGETKFLRAFYYFYLVNLYGDVPLVLSTDPEVNILLARSTKADVYNQIITDLKDAEELLSNNFLNASLLNITTERVRPTKWAATSLLARVYLYKGDDYAKAEEKANAVITNTSLFGPLPLLNNAFLKNSREAIWQIQPGTFDLNTLDGQMWVIPAQGPNTNSNPIFLNKSLLNSFEINDQRAVLGNWIDTTMYNITSTVRDTVYYVNKYKINASPGVSSVAGLTEYFMVLRLAEQYLIRAEARAMQGNISGAQADINVIRTRAGLPNTTANDQASLLTAILNERRHELFCELGQRWFDLKRTGKIDAVMTVETPLKSNGATTWQPYQALYPLPYTELQRAPNLTQNPGY